MRLILVAVLTVFMLGACGWQLRGSMPISANLQSVYLSVENTYGPFATELQQRLNASKIALAEAPELASLSLYIREEQLDRRTAAVGSDALTSAYEVALTIDYEIFTADGQAASPITSASVMRTFNYSASGPDSGTEEEALVLSEMRRELAQTLIRRLAVAAQALDEPTSSLAPADTPMLDTAPDIIPDPAPDGQTPP